VSTGQQVPTRPDRLQATQAPWQAMLQQTWSAQWLERQSVSVAQIPPIGSLPQLPVERSQVCCATHWLESVQGATKQLPLAGLQV